MDFEVVWNGSRQHPQGPYLFVEPEVPVESVTPSGLRRARDLSTGEVSAILSAAQVESSSVIARRFHVAAATVEFLMRAAQSGHLVRS